MACLTPASALPPLFVVLNFFFFCFFFFLLGLDLIPCQVFVPCQRLQKHKFTEIIIFQAQACLPRYLVEIQPTLIPTPKIQIDNTPTKKELQPGLRYVNPIPPSFLL